MPDIELSAGTIHYQDTGDHGPTVVFLHGADGPHPMAQSRARRCQSPTAR
jgi:pimeloyl-ACP methyl ester carboxylesterase